MLLRPAMEHELPLILREAAAFDLDVQLPDYRQFLIAEQEQVLVGFGRIIDHTGFCELATLGVMKNEQRKGIGSALVRALIDKSDANPVLLVTVLPDYFKRLGFVDHTEDIAEFGNKIRFCLSFGFSREEVRVMRFKAA